MFLPYLTSTISNNSFGSYILGGFNNTITAVEKSIILGNHSNQNASSSILIGNNINNELIDFESYFDEYVPVGDEALCSSISTNN